MQPVCNFYVLKLTYDAIFTCDLINKIMFSMHQTLIHREHNYFPNKEFFQKGW